MKGRIAFICPYPYDTVGGQRFRFEQYYSSLEGNGYQLKVLPFLDKSTFKVLYKNGHYLQKIIGVSFGYIKRIVHLLLLLNCNFVFIYREASPIGYPLFEWIICKVFRKKVIYDFDDAIWLEGGSEQNKLMSFFKYNKKVPLICKWSHKVSVGNGYLLAYSLKYNSNSIINPTTIDIQRNNDRVKNQSAINKIVIGWTGTHSTLKYLDMIVPVIQKLEKRFDIEFHVIADKKADYNLKSMRYKTWNKNTEIEDLLCFNIGLMPLTDDKWSQGKCGFKALQYMSLGIPAVVSPVGVNNDIVIDGKNGFTCKDENEWYDKLSLLIYDENLRREMGKQAIAKVKSEYSTLANRINFLNLFRS